MRKFVRSRFMRQHYIAGNEYEGCGHRHMNLLTAMACLTKLTKKGASNYSVYRITYRKSVRKWLRRSERITA